MGTAYFLDAVIASDPGLARVTPESITAALKDFPLPLSPARDTEWLAICVRRALAIAMPSNEERPDRNTNRELRATFRGQADLAAELYQSLSERSHILDGVMFDYAVSRCFAEEDGTMIGPSFYARLESAIDSVEWLSTLIRNAGDAIETQSGPWRTAEERKLRVYKGQLLAAIFEAAFGHPPTANNYPSDSRHSRPTPFMDFYQAIVALAFGERQTPNLADVLKEACRFHKTFPVQFADGLMPHGRWAESQL
jgi:hypothetical protein